jgi:hypothetical protein
LAYVLVGVTRQFLPFWSFLPGRLPPSDVSSRGQAVNQLQTRLIMDFQSLPGGDLIERGVADLAKGAETIEALLVSVGAHRLRRAGFDIPSALTDPEMRLYEILAREDSDSAHGRYNALIRRLVSFERAAECVR